ncbi:hypothetical protein GCM10011487_54280 [Steroidobacter agaridevorans]|uniref:VTT domain-containing protein n=1 Tax=Steroidobacter agaridevorans TaxID=2695856 RepID=A0A829YL00_9GAMM|nr:hypothetical protein GCM10011487_54280 [Steroidobacter agaridevorans]
MLKIAFAGTLTAAIFLLLFALACWLRIDVLIDTAWLADLDSTIAAVACVALLIADAVLPAPSSLLLIALGALLGKVLGAAAGFFGTMGGAALAFWIGRKGSVLFARIGGNTTSAQLQSYLNRFGVVTVIATRPIPVVAETVAVLAGASGMEWGRFLLGAALGNFPIAIVYSILGSSAATNRMLLVALIGIATALSLFRSRLKEAGKVEARLP